MGYVGTPGPAVMSLGSNRVSSIGPVNNRDSRDSESKVYRSHPDIFVEKVSLHFVFSLIHSFMKGEKVRFGSDKKRLMY